MWEFSTVVCSNALNQFVILCRFFKVSAVNMAVLMSLDFQCSHAGFLRGLSASTSYYIWGSDPSPLSSVSVFLVECRCSGFFCDVLRRNRANLEARSFGWGPKSRYWLAQSSPASFVWPKAVCWLKVGALSCNFHVWARLNWVKCTLNVVAC